MAPVNIVELEISQGTNGFPFDMQRNLYGCNFLLQENKEQHTLKCLVFGLANTKTLSLFLKDDFQNYFINYHRFSFLAQTK